MQIPGIADSQPAPAAPDSSAGLGQIERAVERATEVRSLDDVWRLAGEFQRQEHLPAEHLFGQQRRRQLGAFGGRRR